MEEEKKEEDEEKEKVRRGFQKLFIPFWKTWWMKEVQKERSEGENGREER